MQFVVALVALSFFSCEADPPSSSQCNGLVDSALFPSSCLRKIALPETGHKDGDQNVLIQGGLLLRASLFPEDLLDGSVIVQDHLHDTNVGTEYVQEDVKFPARDDTVPITEMYTGLKQSDDTITSRMGPIERLAVKPGEGLARTVSSIAALGAPKGWFLVPAMGCLFVLLLQCTDVHADTNSMDDEMTRDAQPPAKPDRMLSWDVVRFALLLAIVWTQLLRLYGSNDLALQAQEFVWPSWFFVCGIFGSTFTYESLARTICYCLATNFMLTFTSLLFAFFNYNFGGVDLHINGSWLLWSLLFFRLTITPGYHAAKALRLPGVFYLILVYGACFYVRSRTATHISSTPGAPSIEPLLLFVSSWEAVFQSALLHAPYYATGLLMTPSGWNDLLKNRWAITLFASGAMLWLILSGSPLLCRLTHWRCSSSSWGVQVRLHALYLGELREDIELYIARMGCMFLLVCFAFTCAQLLSRCALRLFQFVARCGSRVRFSLAVLVLWHMSRPCILKPLQIPFERPFWLTDLTMVWLALILVLMFTSDGISRLFQWIFEPYWVKSLFEISIASFTTNIKLLGGTPYNAPVF